MTKYNILIIGIETCRKDALQCYNPNRDTPFIQKFAEKSLVFDNYFTNAGNTYQSWGCVFTGKYAHNSGIATKPARELNVKLMSDIFSEHVYNVHMGCFNIYGILGSEIEYPSLSEDITEPFFSFEAGIDGHTPYGFTEKIFRESDVEQLKDAHFKSIEKQDIIFENIINKYLKFSNDMIVILTADHGDNITNGDATHDDNISDDTINIPFILYHPKIKPRIISDLFSSIDVFPTILGFCGIKYDHKFDGMDMSSYILDNIQFPNRTIQIGPSVGCKNIRLLYQGNGGEHMIQQYDYSREEVLMRYKDYKNREYVNMLFERLEKNNYFKDDCMQRADTYNNLYWPKNEEYIDSIISTLELKPGLKIVDAGSGTGIVSTYITDIIDNMEIYSIDKCYSMLSKIPENEKIKKFVSDIGHMAFIHDNSIDRIICRMVLHSEFEHIDNILKEFLRVLKTDGILVISEGVPINDSLLDFYRSFLTIKEKRDVFTKDAFINIIKEFQEHTKS